MHIAASYTHSFSRSGFTGTFLKVNCIENERFGAWLFESGMLFGAKQNWWGVGQERSQPHEGIDLCFYRDSDNRIVRFDERIKIPAMYDGTVVKMFQDFLGISVIMEHRLSVNQSIRFLTIYGHTKPEADLEAGRVVKAGQTIAFVASPRQLEKPPPPHLHLTIAWSPDPLDYGSLDWTTINDPGVVRLVDPLQALDGPYDSFSQADKA
jgi:murein DD-endopeptidase MepM/ murein hydrolase activator NlpD